MKDEAFHPPYPGKGGKAPYCGVGRHFYRCGLAKGEPEMRCVDCGHIKGKRRRSNA